MGINTVDPWEDITAPSMAETVNARRVDAELRWNFFWARDFDGKVLLTLSHDQSASPANPIPRMRDIDVTLSPPDSAGSRILALKLLDLSQRDIFHILCQDIVSASSGAGSEAEAVSVTLMRTWRWHHLLRTGTGTLLSAQAQMGLMGELILLERLMLPLLGTESALTAWRGPLDSPKDFEFGRVAVESKARRGGSASAVTIASEDQLDESGVDHLFLSVIEFDRASEDAEGAVTLQQVSHRIRQKLRESAPGALLTFETLLLAAGLRPEDDYSDFYWMEGASHAYHVRDEFPRITHNELRSGISRVRYVIELGECESFRISDEVLIRALEDMGEDIAN